MIKVYLKQAWELLKQNKLFSMLYIVGTGLTIAMTMIMAVVYYAKIAPVYPEANRMNTLYLSNSKFTQGSGNNTRTMQWAVSYKALQDWFYPVENALVVLPSCIMICRKTVIYSLPTAAVIFRLW